MYWELMERPYINSHTIKARVSQMKKLRQNI